MPVSCGSVQVILMHLSIKSGEIPERTPAPHKNNTHTPVRVFTAKMIQMRPNRLKQFQQSVLHGHCCRLDAVHECMQDCWKSSRLSCFGSQIVWDLKISKFISKIRKKKSFKKCSDQLKGEKRGQTIRCGILSAELFPFTYSPSRPLLKEPSSPASK